MCVCVFFLRLWRGREREGERGGEREREKINFLRLSSVSLSVLETGRFDTSRFETNSSQVRGTIYNSTK